jgi:hypothetical protein
MFTTGFRELIINGNDGVLAVATGTGVPTGIAPVATDWLKIDPLGYFDPTLLAAAFTPQASAPAVVGSVTVADAEVDVDLGQTTHLKYYWSYAGRPLSEVYPERKTSIFQVQSLVGGTLGVQGAAAVYDHPFFDSPVELTNNGGALKATFKPGYEGYSVIAVTFEQFDANGVSLAPEAKVALSAVVAGSEGIGLGKLLEASVKTAVAENLPYAPNEFGSDMPDVRGTYRTYAFDMPANPEGWAEHEDTGRSIVNQLNAGKPTRYILYVNEASAATAILYLNEFALGVFT